MEAPTLMSWELLDSQNGIVIKRWEGMDPSPKEMTPALHRIPAIKGLRKGKFATNCLNFAKIEVLSTHKPCVSSLSISCGLLKRLSIPLLFHGRHCASRG